MLAVSGGVDSVALLHLLAQRPEVQLTVAHFDHGIRTDSAEDQRFVQKLAQKYRVPFVYQVGNMGLRASEAAARRERYKFLHQVRKSSGAQAIITAHHQDDVLETIILNLLRGTGWRGLNSLKSTDTIKRPLLPVPKSKLISYAKREGLEWREDSTNQDERYLRNYIRQRILPRFACADREALLGMRQLAAKHHAAVAGGLANYLHLQPRHSALDRHQFILLPHAVAREVMAEWLRVNTEAELSKRLLERLVVGGKTARSGSKIDVNAGYWLTISHDRLALLARER